MNKFLLCLAASFPGTAAEKDDAAFLAAVGTPEDKGPCRRIEALFGFPRVPLTDVADDNRPSPIWHPGDFYRGLAGTSRGYAVEIVVSASRDERDALTPSEVAAIVDALPADVDGRPWGGALEGGGP